MLDASLERPKIFFANYHVHVAGIVIDQCSAQRRAIGDMKLSVSPSLV